MLKKIIKYLSIQLVILFKKNFFLNKNLDFNQKKIIFIKSKGEKLNICQSVFKKCKNYLVASYDQKAVYENDLSSRNFLFSTRRIPNSNAEVLYFEKHNFSIEILPIIKCNYLSVRLSDLLISFFNNYKYFINNGYYLYSLNLSRRRFLFAKKNKVNELQARKYIPYHFTRISFLKKISKSKLNLVILRGFENLKNIKSFDEDIDLLIQEKDIKLFEKILEDSIGLIPIDLYSDSGETKTSFGGLPYYPKKIAQRILKNKQLNELNFYVPNKLDHLLSFSFHLVFHKSLKSGLSINRNHKNLFKGKKNYKQHIKLNLKQNQKQINEITLESLSNFLEENDFYPEYDYILKLQHLINDDWFNFLVNKIRDKIDEKYFKVKGITLFLLREKACSNDLMNIIEKRISDFGFFLIKKINIPEKLSESVNSSIRGGKWDIGPYEINAGCPKVCYVLFDPFPVIPRGKFLKQYPHLENKKSIQLKIHLRNEINNIVPKSLNSIHSSDDFYEAVFYLNKIINSSPKTVNIINHCQIINNSHKTFDNVLIDYSRFAVRSKVELIMLNNQKVIKKTYKNNKLNYLKNEIWFLNKFSHNSLVPKLITYDSNSLTVEYFKNSITLDKTKLKTKHIIQLQSFFKELYSKKITLLDVNPTNVLIDENDNVKIIDFEYAQSYKIKPNNIQLLYELSHFSPNNVEVYPFGHENIKNAYNKFWLKKTKLTIAQFLFTNNMYLIKFLRCFNTLPIFFYFFLTKKIKSIIKHQNDYFAKFNKLT